MELESKITLELECRLEGEELGRKAAEMAEASHSLDEARQEYAEVGAEFRKKIKGLESELSALGEQVRSKSVTRMVDCTRLYDAPRQLVGVVRDDTGEVIDSRHMDETEADATRGAPEPSKEISEKIARHWELQERADQRERLATGKIPAGSTEVDLTAVRGIGPAKASALVEAGLDSAEAIESTPVEDIAVLAGVGPDIAAELKSFVASSAHPPAPPDNVVPGPGANAEDILGV